MVQKQVSISVLLLFLSLVAQANTITVGSQGYDYTSIQEAIDAASPGDVVEVYGKTYNENVNVNKKLTLLGIDIGEGIPTVNANGSSAITLSSDGITLKGFKAMNSEIGIQVNSSNNIIVGNHANLNNGIGISFYDSKDNVVVDNYANYNLHGISLFNSDHNIIKDNDGMYNDIYSIELWNSSNNLVVNNYAGYNKAGGIYLVESSNNLVANNDASYNKGPGIFIWQDSSNNFITGNDANYNVANGIYLFSSTNYNTLVDNRVSHNEGNGIYLSICGFNTLYKNVFVDNGVHNAYDEGGSNQWDNGAFGNFYSDIDCIDENEDDICDSPYDIPGGKSVDQYPLAAFEER